LSRSHVLRWNWRPKGAKPCSEQTISWVWASIAVCAGLLLAAVYYLGGGALLLDAGSSVDVGTGAAIGVGSMAAAWFVYDGLWNTGLGRSRAGPVLGWALVVGAAWALDQVLSGRAAYVHVGAMLGTIMVANVWVRIIPAQRRLVAATREGREPDPALGARAKARSIHNNYLSLPLVFIMISNHFWGTFGHEYGWAVLGSMFLVGAGVRHLLNARLDGRRVPVGAVALVVGAIAATVWVTRSAGGETGAAGAGSAADVGSSGPSARAGEAGGLGSGGGVPSPGDEVPDSGAGAATGGATSERGRRTVDPDTVGAIAGFVRVDGEAPAPATLRLLSECQAHHTGPVLDETLLVREGGVANAFVRLVSGHEGWEPPPVPAREVVVDQVGCLYRPRVVGVRVGQDLTFVNSDPLLHNVHGTPERNREFNFGMPGRGDRRTVTLRREEVMAAVRCDVHPWMAAYVGVVEHPWFAVTDETGAFRIDGVPPGEYEVEVWHEALGAETRPVTVEPGETADVSLESSVEGR